MFRTARECVRLQAAVLWTISVPGRLSGYGLAHLYCRHGEDVERFGYSRRQRPVVLLRLFGVAYKVTANTEGLGFGGLGNSAWRSVAVPEDVVSSVAGLATTLGYRRAEFGNLRRRLVVVRFGCQKVRGVVCHRVGSGLTNLRLSTEMLGLATLGGS